MPHYLDNNATTQLDARVFERMRPFMVGPYGNPSSAHRYGRVARAAIDKARAQVAALVDAQPNQVLFTSGGSEANNLVIQGVLARSPKARMLVSAIEHPAILEPAAREQQRGRPVAQIPVDEQGLIDQCRYRELLAESTALVSIMWANNETGVLQDMALLTEQAHADGALMHSDAVQAAGKIPLSFRESGLDLMSLAAHKLHGPKGMGALLLKKQVDLTPLMLGGGQEEGLRPGTENLAAIVGFGAAAELAGEELENRHAHMAKLSRLLREQLDALAEQHNISVFAAEAPRLPNTLQFSVAGITGETLLLELDRRGVAISSGSACATGKAEPSHVLLAMGIDPVTAEGAIRVSFSKDNKAADVDALMQALSDIVRGLPKR